MTKYDSQKSHAYYLAHREEIIRKAREYYLDHRDQQKATGKRHRLAHPEKYAGYSRAAAKRFREMRERKAEAQNFTCPCGKPLGDERALDHDHACCNKTVRSSCRKCDRSVMHMSCNGILGLVGEDPEVLRRLADYLDREHGRLKELRETA